MLLLWLQPCTEPFVLRMSLQCALQIVVVIPMKVCTMIQNSSSRVVLLVPQNGFARTPFHHSQPVMRGLVPV